MCSIEADEEISSLIDGQIKELSIESKHCTKCSLPAIIALRSDDIYCRECFLIRATHKFRCEFGKSRLIRDNEKVLVAYTGGRNSCAMVHLIQEGLSKRAQKKLRFTPDLIYIDDDDYGKSCGSQEQKTHLWNVLDKLHETGLTYYFFTLKQVYDIDLVPVLSNSNGCNSIDYERALQALVTDERQKFRMLMESATTETARESLVSLLRRELLVRVARQMKYEKILVGDSATSLASRLLSNIVEGRGAQVPYEMGFVDDRHEDVIFVKPLREFTEKEIDTYNTLYNILPLVAPKLENSVMTIERLSKQFVAGLQAEHGSTLAIICRTGEKLDKLNDEASEGHEKCILCQALLDNGVSSTCASATNAMDFSSTLCHLLQVKNQRGNINCDSSKQESSLVPSLENSAVDFGKHQVLNDGISSKRNLYGNGLSLIDIVSCLCYGCKLVVQEMADVETLPSSILHKAKTRCNNRDQMKSSIEEYLLGDDSVENEKSS